MVLDLLLGDPPKAPHPVRWIGRLIHLSESALRPFSTGPMGERMLGGVLALWVVGAAYFGAFFLIMGAAWLHEWIGWAVAICLAFTTLSARSLADAARRVQAALSAGHLVAARRHLKALVGRRRDDLDQEEAVKATVESVAENVSDGVVAPLFFLAIGGPPLGMAYKAVNTLDSMIGYKTPRYFHFGWPSARLDDLANFLPARMTALAIAMVGGILGEGMRSFRTMRDDGHKHESPNSGYPEAAMAGLLGISLGGHRSHEGKPGNRPVMGEALEPPKADHIRRAVHVLYGVTMLAVILFGAIHLWLGS